MTDTTPAFDDEFDVIVVGAGAAGLSAALSAVEETGGSARVAVLERSTKDIRGGNTRWSGAYLRLQNTTTPVPNLVEYAMSASKGYANRDYYDALVREVPEAFDWLHEQGVELKSLPTIFLTLSATRYQPAGGGVNIVEPLFARLEATSATVLYETSAESLITDDRGRIIGLRVRERTGQVRTLGAGAVVLACGGFQGNREMMSKYVGRNAYRVPPISRGGAHNRGDGLRMALEVGAATEGQFDLFHAEPKDPRSAVAEAVVMTYPYGILVNSAGERFLDEGAKTVDLTYETVARTILQQDDSIGYAVFDQQVKQIPGYEHAIGTDVEPYTADSVEELETLLGLPAGSLVRTVAEFNAASADDVPFGWSKLDGLASRPAGQPVKSNWARPLTEGPFFAYPQICANVFTFGGVKTDLDAQVITSDGHPIDGLFGAGEMTGLYYEAYAGSTSVMRSITFGRIAGRNAARLSLQNTTERAIA
ncbi:FAD-dependent oxidoreductase [Salinibacterium sp. ZJ450]|uniref:FAD-dependent oxidoreductase n=1 Tax=Salinibacterium sp. ZJ450 TaxID=2708338 RepID=UPI0014224B59|nr:FAD-dependent oxidoreductase [Salinibacterium sp. ZJ450]